MRNGKRKRSFAWKQGSENGEKSCDEQEKSEERQKARAKSSFYWPISAVLIAFNCSSLSWLRQASTKDEFEWT